jgi:hypothetical protein
MSTTPRHGGRSAPKRRSPPGDGGRSVPKRRMSGSKCPDWSSGVRSERPVAPPRGNTSRQKEVFTTDRGTSPIAFQGDTTIYGTSRARHGVRPERPRQNMAPDELLRRGWANAAVWALPRTRGRSQAEPGGWVAWLRGARMCVHDRPMQRAHWWRARIALAPRRSAPRQINRNDRYTARTRQGRPTRQYERGACARTRRELESPKRRPSGEVVSAYAETTLARAS